MKKVCLTLILSMAMLCMHSAIAVAESGHYTTGVNSYSNSETNGARTVMIYKGEQNDSVMPENIYYINQTDSEAGFSNLEMLIKRDAPAGVYTISTNEKGKFATFNITPAQAEVVGGKEMNILDVRENQKDSTTTYSIAYVISTKSALTESSTISMLYDEKLYTTTLNETGTIIEWVSDPIFYTDIDGEQRAIIAIQIDGVSDEYVDVDNESGKVTPKFKLYLKDK